MMVSYISYFIFDLFREGCPSMEVVFQGVMMMMMMIVSTSIIDKGLSHFIVMVQETTAVTFF